jgi:putative restriction endonuclease
MDALSTYVRKFSKLRVDRSKGEPAPHKAILLLSIIDSIQHQEITENKIYISPELVARFKDNWHKLVSNNKFTSNFALPFYHLKSEGFWLLKTVLGREILLTSSHSIKSFAQLKEVVDYAWFSEDLFQFLSNQHTGNILKHALITTYFPSAAYNADSDSNGVINEVVSQILNEAPAVYRLKADSFDEEEVFIRGGVFKRVVPKVYNFTCSISGMRLIANRDIQMIDACHIVPFSQSYDDTISNGISLCPNLHRAFDRGLITIDEGYRVVTSSNFSESGSDYSIRAYHGKKILLPHEHCYYPSLENLEWHRNNIFKN